MREYNVIKRGQFSSAHSNDYVSVVNYMIVEEGNTRYVMLKCFNDRKQTVDGVSIRLIQLGTHRKKLVSEEITIDELFAKANEEFAIEPIEVQSECEGIIVEVLSARSGNYRVTQKNDQVSVEYLHNEGEEQAKIDYFKAILGSKKTDIKARRFRAPVLIATFAIVIVFLLSAALLLQLFRFKKTTTQFCYDDIEYKFSSGVNTENGDITVTGYNGYTSEIRIPATLDGHRVVAVEEKAFYGNKDLKKVVFESDVSLGEMAFSGCTNLETVELGPISAIAPYSFFRSGLRSVTATNVHLIGTMAFSSCSQLTEISFSLPEGESLRLEKNSFYSCSELTSITLSCFTEYHDTNVFRLCKKIKHLKLSNFNVTSEGATNYLLNKVFNSSVIETVEISHLGAMPARFVENLPITTFHVNVLDQTTIYENTFHGCSNLRSLVLPNTISQLDAYCFEGTAIESYDASNVERMAEYAFANNSALKEVTISEQSPLVEIGRGVFSECTALQNITLPVGVTNIPMKAFYSCKSLQQVNILGDISHIDEEAFAECERLNYIKLSNAITVIERAVFRDCSALGNINFPTTLSRISEEAFAGCASLSTVSFPVTLTEIGDSAFAGSGLISVELPVGISVIGQSAFKNCHSLQSFTSPIIGGGDDGSDYFGYPFEGSEENDIPVALPSSLTHVYITRQTEIADGAFQNCTNLQLVHLPEAVTSIGFGVFDGCSSLQSIPLPVSLKTIGNDAFAHCTSLTEIALPEGILSVGDNAFKNCIAVRKISLSSTIESVGFGAFEGCSSVTEMLSFFIGGSRTGSDAYLGYIFGEDSFDAYGKVPSTLQKYTLNYSGEIPSYAFYYLEGLHEIVINGSITGIGVSAFEGCLMLRDIVLPEGIRTINSYAFAHCRSLPYIVLPASLQSISSSAFEGCYNLYELCNLSDLSVSVSSAFNVFSDTEARLPRVEVDGYTFLLYADKWYLTGFPAQETDLSLPTQFKYGEAIVSEYALALYLFRNYDLLKSITIPTAVSEWQAYTFAESNCLESVTFAEFCPIVNVPSATFYECDALQRVVLPNTVQQIAEHAFYGATMLNEINLPIGVKEIGAYAFAHTVELQELSFPQTLSSLAEGAFFASGLKSVMLPNSLSSVGEYVFADNYSLKDAVLPYSLQTIPRGMFEGSDSLQTISLSAQLVNIDSFAFMNCSALTTVQLPETLKTIGESAFSSTGLTEIIIPSGVVQMGLSAFSDNSNLNKVTILASALTKIENFTFKNCKIQELTLTSGIKTVGTYAFENNELQSLVLPDGIELLEEGAFKLNRISEITMPSTLKTIEAYAFSDNQLQKIILSANVEKLGPYAFLGNTNVSEIVLNEGLKTIGRNAFYGMTNLTTLTLPASLLSVDQYAFADCSNLSELIVYTSPNFLNAESFLGCTRLYEIFNLSEAAPLTCGDGVATYAFAIYTSLEAERVVAEDLACVFVKESAEWYLRKLPQNTFDGICTLPESFTFQGSTISSYQIKDPLNLNLYEAIVIPRSVTNISANTFDDANYFLTVYYMGTAEKWATIATDCSLQPFQVYIYASCVHATQDWTYDSNHNITTQQYLETVTVRASTCVEAGEDQIVCTICEQVLSSIALPLVPHTLGVDGKCSVCQQACTAITVANGELKGAFSNDESYPFIFNEQGISSVNMGSSTKSVLTFTATAEIQIELSLRVSSEYDCDKLQLQLNDEQLLVMSGEETRQMTVTLAVGDVLSFVYMKDGYGNNGSDCCTIEQIKITLKQDEAVVSRDEGDTQVQEEGEMS